MLHSQAAGPPHLHKRTAPPLYSIFTSSPTNTAFKKAIFKRCAPSKSDGKENHQISSPSLSTEAFCLEEGGGNGSCQSKGEPDSLAPETAPVTALPDCESEPPAAGHSDEDDEDATVFFTPELFDDEQDEDSTEKEMKAESPSEVVSGTGSVAPLHGSEHAHRQGHTSAFDGQGAISVSEESTELSQGRKEEIRRQGEGREEDETQCSRLSRLSRSRKKTSSTLTGF